MLKIDKMFPFEGPRTIIILDVIFIYLMIPLMGNAQLIFQLLDSEINEVVFVDETGITFRCSFNGSETTDVTMGIEDPDGNILTDNNQAMFAEYTIQKVTMDHGGVYTCKVTYMCVDGNNLTAKATLLLNVQDDSMPRCVRNGTVGQPYKPGDLLLLSCYCREGDECGWFSTVEGTGDASILEAKEERESIGRKEIVRVLVNYTSDTDNKTRYDCFRQGSNTCKIGPLEISSNDIIAKSMTNITSTVECVFANRDDTTDREMSSETIEKRTVTVSSHAANQNISDSTTTILLIGGAVFLLVIVVVSFLCISKFGRRKSNLRDKDEDIVHDDNYDDVDRTAIINKAAHQGCETTGNDVSSSCYEVTNENSLYDAPPMNNFMPGNQDGENYTEINRSRVGQQPASERYGEEHTVLSQSERELPPPDTMNLNGDWNHDQSETSTVDGNLQLDLSVSDSVVYAKVDTSKSSSRTEQRKVKPQINNEVRVIYATVARKSDRIT